MSPDGRVDRRQHRRRRRRVARRLAGRRDPARRGLRGDDLAGRRGAAPSLRPAAAVQAGAGRDVAPREGGAGGQATVERAPGARGPRPPRRPARRGGAEGRARRRHRARGRRHRHHDRRAAPRLCRAPRTWASATGCSRCAPSTTPSPCAPPSRRSTTARVVVIGAGFIGAEVASTCAGLGCRVTVLEALDVPLRNVLGPLIGRHFASLHGSHGVDLRTGVGVQRRRATPAPRSRAEGSGRAGWWSSSTAARRSPPTSSWWASAWCPTTDWLADSGLTLDNGVVCDDRLFAADGIVAAGDIARWQWRHDGGEELIRIEHWQVAAEAGVAAARSLLAGRADAPPSRRSRTSGPISTASASRCWEARAGATRSTSPRDRSRRASSSRSSAGPAACAPSWPSASPGS